eukprot:5450512-Lingulodinium_polyedra.AAC.1
MGWRSRHLRAWASASAKSKSFPARSGTWATDRRALPAPVSRSAASGEGALRLPPRARGATADGGR